MKPLSAIAAIVIVGVGAYALLDAIGSVDDNSVDDAATSTAELAAIPVSSNVDRKGKFNDDFAALNQQRSGVTTLPSGVQYEVLEPGFGDTPGPADTVLVRYEAWLPDGRAFDTTEEDQEPLELAIESVAVPGLREALLLMDEGAYWRVVIPPGEGFGRFGNNRLRRNDLIYEIRLVSILGSDA